MTWAQAVQAPLLVSRLCIGRNRWLLAIRHEALPPCFAQFLDVALRVPVLVPAVHQFRNLGSPGRMDTLLYSVDRITSLPSGSRNNATSGLRSR